MIERTRKQFWLFHFELFLDRSIVLFPIFFEEEIWEEGWQNFAWHYWRMIDRFRQEMLIQSESTVSGNFLQNTTRETAIIRQ